MTEPARIDDPLYRAGVTDLLGLLAYAELVAFFRLSDDAALAPSIADKAALGEMAVAEFGHFRLVRDHLVQLGADPEEAMQPFVAPLEEFHAKTAPSSWPESLVKAYVGDGIAADFYRMIAELLDPPTRALVHEVLTDMGHGEFAVERIQAAIEADPSLSGRLALWARRIVGEGLGQAQRVAAERAPLAHLIATGAAPDSPGGGDGPAGQHNSDLGDIGRMFARITDQHTRRMATLGMDA